MAKKLSLSSLSLDKEDKKDSKPAKTPVKTERKAKTPITYNLEPAKKKELQKLALELDTDMTKLLDEAVELLFVEHNWS